MNGNLSLSRRPGESILIGDDITLTVTKVLGQRAYFNVSAPKEIRVDRDEVRERIEAERMAAL